MNWYLLLICAVSGAVSKQLVRIDSKYAALFSDGAWKDSTADRLDMSARFGLFCILYCQLLVNTYVYVYIQNVNTAFYCAVLGAAK